MKNAYIAILVLVLATGGLFFLIKGKKTEAPIVNTEESSILYEQTVPEENVTTFSNGESPSPETSNINTDNAKVKEFTISGSNFTFSPSSIMVNKGDKVKIIFKNSEGFHDFVIDEFGAATKQTKAPTIEVIEFTADKVGNFAYYCSVGSHRQMGMQGILTVK